MREEVVEATDACIDGSVAAEFLDEVGDGARPEEVGTEDDWTFAGAGVDGVCPEILFGHIFKNITSEEFDWLNLVFGVVVVILG